MKHPSWNYRDLSEAEVIVNKLMEHSIPKDAIIFETNSLHSIANVMEAKKIFDFTKINRLLFVCKSLGAGRQYRVLKNIYLTLLLVFHLHLIQVSMVSL